MTYYTIPDDVDDRLADSVTARHYLAGLTSSGADAAADRVDRFFALRRVLTENIGEIFQDRAAVRGLIPNLGGDRPCPVLGAIAEEVLQERDREPAAAAIAQALAAVDAGGWARLREVTERIEGYRGEFSEPGSVGAELVTEFEALFADRLDLVVQFDRDRWHPLGESAEAIAAYTAADCIRHLSALCNVHRWHGGVLAGAFDTGYVPRVLRRLLACVGPVPAGPEPLDAHVCARLGAYVYALVDPRDRSIFYVGKGRGNRLYTHTWTALAQTATLAQMPEDQRSTAGEPAAVTSVKLARIRDIYAAGYRVEHWILRHRITAADSDDGTAFQIEQSLIDALRLIDVPTAGGARTLTNIAGGHTDTDHRAMRASHLAVLYGAQPAPLPLPQPSVVLRVNAAADPTWSDEQIYAATRGDWRATGVLEVDGLLAFVLADDVIRAVFRIESWTPVGDKWQFTGAIDPETDARYRGRRLRSTDLGYTAGWPQQGWARRT